jgi:hypothetical protein
MENGRLCSWMGELESVSPHREIDLCLMLDDTLRRRTERIQRDLERLGWSVVGNDCCSRPEMEWDDIDGFEII